MKKRATIIAIIAVLFGLSYKTDPALTAIVVDQNNKLLLGISRNDKGTDILKYKLPN